MIKSWLQSIDIIFSKGKQFYLLFDILLQASIDFIEHCIEPVPSVDNNLCKSLMNIIDCLLKPFIQSPDIDEDDKIPAKIIQGVNDGADSLFIFALIWSVGHLQIVLVGKNLMRF